MFQINTKNSHLIFSFILFTNLINASSSSFQNFPNIANIQVFGQPFKIIYNILMLMEENERKDQIFKLELPEFLDLSLATQTLENCIEDEQGKNPEYSTMVGELENFITQNGKDIPEILSKLNKAKKERSQHAQRNQFINKLQRSKALTKTDTDFSCIGRFYIGQINQSFQEAWTNSINSKDQEMLITFLISAINDKINLNRTSKKEFENILRELRIISEEYNKIYHFSEYIQKRLKETIAVLEKISSL